MHIAEDEKSHSGILRFRTALLPWSVPVQKTIKGETVRKIELDSMHLERTMRIDEILPSRNGKIKIVVSKTWVLQQFQPDSKEARSLSVLVDYESGSLLKQ